MAKKIKWSITAKKAITTGVGFVTAFAVALQGVEVPEDVGTFEQALPGIAVAVVLAVIRAANNVRKNIK